MKALEVGCKVNGARQQFLQVYILKKKQIWIAGLILGLIFCGIWIYLNELRDSEAKVDGQMHPVAVAVDGRIASVLVQENQKVKAGEPLIHLEAAQLGALLAETQTRLDALRLGVSPDSTDLGSSEQPNSFAEEAIRARIQAARTEESFARQNLEDTTAAHAKALYEARRQDATSRSGASAHARAAEQQARLNMDAARASFEVISRARAAADAQLLRYRSDIARAAAMPAELRARQIELQEARLKQAEQKYAATVIIAPTNGSVTRLNASVGAPVREGQIIASIMPSSPEHLWITAHIAESKIDKVEPGTPCSLVFPALQDFKLAGVVDSIQNTPPLSNENSTPRSSNSRTKIAVRIAIPEYNSETMPALQIGMQARVRINPLF